MSAMITNISTHRRVACAVPGCKHASHILVEHLMDVHSLKPSDYLAKFPGAPLYSELGRQKLASAWESKIIAPVERKTEKVRIKDVFKPYLKSNEEIVRYVDPGPLTMKVDENYIFPEQQTMYLLMALDEPSRNAVYAAGPAGTGKTQLCIQAPARLNYEMLRLNGDSYQGRSEWIGEWKVRGQDMVFQYGALPIAMKLGILLLIDEVDCLNPHVMNILRPVLEENPRLVIQENGGEVIEAAEGFQVLATANTWGTGDTSGLYGTTNVMSAADRQRFSVFIKMEYLPVAVEEKILKQRFPDLDEEVEPFVRVANEIREQHKLGKIDEAFSPRQLINWAGKYILLGDVLEAARVSFLNAMPAEIGVAVQEIIKHAFPQS